MRTLAFLFGCLTILAGIFIWRLGSVPGDEDAVAPVSRRILFLLAVALMAFGLLHAALRGGRMAHSRKHCVITAILLLPALGGGIYLLLDAHGNPPLHFLGVCYLLPVCALLLWSIWPLRRMARRIDASHG